MMPLRLSEIRQVLGLSPDGADASIDSIVTDSRKVRYGSLFAALPGRTADGHDFVKTAVETGAVAVLVQRPVATAVPQLLVDDVLVALGRIAALLRQKVAPKVVGITGSNGKTTIKEMLASILRQNAEVLATEGNYNNELGVPLTLFRLEQKHRYAVLEMGASKGGDIAYLAGIARPDVGVISNIGPAHLEGFGSVEGVARAKGEMYQALPKDGCAVINGAEPFVELWRNSNSAGDVLTFGFDTNNNQDFDIHMPAGGSSPSVSTPLGHFNLQLALPGRHNQLNALAATAAAVALKVPVEQIAAGLQAVKPVPGRLNVLHADAGWLVIDDTYNANPASLYSALQVLAGMQGKAWLVLGDMKELGEDSRKLHAEVGDAARAMGVRRIFATGEMSQQTVDAFGAGAEHFADREQLIAALKSELRPGINCLVKGSRSMGMEQVVHAIVGNNLKKAS
ncbi:MAG TPA: UDP-N-acetylmuramoyl-tripeptide--D-alanyl-D-alanine ligase [Xanthomonadales bacterium]|nr:UDP-N-acetylmuramoyl-tripeptide--D-alanyl-D-alanine ligase [Xanthomonadales bacterium]